MGFEGGRVAERIQTGGEQAQKGNRTHFGAFEITKIVKNKTWHEDFLAGVNQLRGTISFFSGIPVYNI